MLVIFGWNSQISEELRGLVRPADIAQGDLQKGPWNADRYFFAQGYMASVPAQDNTRDEMAKTINANFLEIMLACEHIFSHNLMARVCIIGSESGITGSGDRLYGAAKAAMHKYVETRRISVHQQLVCIAPFIISDAGMTLRRQHKDAAILEQRREKHPKKRFLRSIEVARLAHFCLYQDLGYLTNCVIRMNGGEHTR